MRGFSFPAWYETAESDAVACRNLQT